MTAELATCLPVLVLLLAAAVSIVGAVSTRVRAEDAAREAARAAARADAHGDGGAVTKARRVAPGAEVAVTRHGDEVVVTVSTRTRPLGGVVPALTVRASAVAAVEPSTAAPAGAPP